ncbi:glycoside hydrolase family 78 protein [bacterium]|nr:glycoside hydrolase family 78 protein [bacterium]
MNQIINWIWYRPTKNPNNFFLYLRKDFELKNSVEEAAFSVTANSLYMLYVNGTLLGRGPNPGAKNYWYYDTYNVKKYLRKGKNVIAVLAYHYGKDMKNWLNVSIGDAGFLFHGRIRFRKGKSLNIVSDNTWKVKQAQSWEKNTQLISEHRGEYKEIFDANKEIMGWHNIDYDDKLWDSAVLLDKCPISKSTKLLKREIPLFKPVNVFPQNVFMLGYNMAYGHLDNRKWEVENPYNLAQDNDKNTTVRTYKKNQSPSIIIDFGRDVVGHPVVEISESSGGIIDIAYGESLNMTYIDSLIMRKGYQKFSPFRRRACRYLMLTFRNYTRAVDIKRVYFDFIAYPAKEKGSFKCSDNRLNNIWKTAQYTLNLCMQDHYEDCPWREQALYGGDMRSQALFAQYAFGETKLTIKSIRQLARIQDKDGFIPSKGPTSISSGGVIPGYCTYWLVTLVDYYRYTRDIKIIKELYSNISRLMEWFKKQEKDDSIIPELTGRRIYIFIDNLTREIDKEGISTFLQVQYFWALKEAAFLAKEIGENKQSLSWEIMADRLRLKINEKLWDKKKGAYADACHNGKLSSHISQQTNALAVVTGVAEKSKYNSIHKAIFNRKLTEPCRAGYFMFYLIEMLCMMGRRKKAMQRLRTYWGEMIRRGATTFWETHDPETPEGKLPDKKWSLCHAYCAGPLFHLPAEILGIRTKDVGFKKIRISPMIELCEFAKGTVPTTRGNIDVFWERGEKGINVFNLKIPSQTCAKIKLPIQKNVNLSRIYCNNINIKRNIKLTSKNLYFTVEGPKKIDIKIYNQRSIND